MVEGGLSVRPGDSWDVLRAGRRASDGVGGEEDRRRRGPGGRGGYDPLASLRRRMMRGPGGRGPQLPSRGQDKEVKEGARRSRAPARRTRRGPG